MDENQVENGEETSTIVESKEETKSVTKVAKSRLKDPVIMGLTGLIVVLLIALAFVAYVEPTDDPTGDVTGPDDACDDASGICGSSEAEITDTQGATDTSGKKTVTIFSEFLCPYSAASSGADEEAIAYLQQSNSGYVPAEPALRERDDVELVFKHFIVHGDEAQKASEASECARDQGKFWEYHDVLFANRDALSISDLKQYAADLGLDTATFDSCLDSGEKAAKVLADTEEGRALGITGTPTYVLGDRIVPGARTYELLAEALEGQPFDIVIITVDECTYCDSPDMIAQELSQMFPTGNLLKIDISQDQAKEMVSSYAIDVLPAFILDGEVKEMYYYKSLPEFQNILRSVGDKFVLKTEVVQATLQNVYYVDAAKRAAMETQAAEAEKNKLELLGLDTTDNKPQIDFFVMSYCPYGNIAEEAVEPVYRNLGDKAIFNPRYVVYSNYRGGGPDYCLDDESKYCSMHGIQELNQDVRELCVFEHMGIGSYFDFVLEMNTQCNYQNADACWEAVAAGLGLDTGVIKDCEANEALDLLAEQKALNDAFEVSGSPTVLIEGEKFSGSRTPAAYQSALCAAYDDAPAECGEQLDSTAAAASGSCA